MQRIYRVTIVLLVSDDFPIFDWRHDAHSQLILCNSDKRSSKFGLVRAAGSVTRVPVPNRTGPATRPKRTHSITPLRPLIFRLLRDNSKSGRSQFSESLAEKSFRHDNC